MNVTVCNRNGHRDTAVASRFSSLLTADPALFTSSAHRFPRNSFFPRLRSVHRLFQRPSPGKQFPGNHGATFTSTQPHDLSLVGNNQATTGKIHFITYGDQIFKLSRERIAGEAKSIGLFDSVHVYDEGIRTHPEIIQLLETSPDFRRVFTSTRGGGYWLWKPYVLLDMLRKVDAHHIIVYADAGSSFRKKDQSRKMFTSYFQLVRECDAGVIAFRNPYKESIWTKGDIFEHFQVRSDPSITDSRQFNAGRMQLFRNCENALRIYQAWWDIAKNHPHFFDDSPSVSPNLPGFRENRHDQSVWSMICKTNKVVEIAHWGELPISATRIRK